MFHSFQECYSYQREFLGARKLFMNYQRRLAFCIALSFSWWSRRHTKSTRPFCSMCVSNLCVCVEWVWLCAATRTWVMKWDNFPELSKRRLRPRVASCLVYVLVLCAAQLLSYSWCLCGGALFINPPSEKKFYGQSSSATTKHYFIDVRLMIVWSRGAIKKGLFYPFLLSPKLYGCFGSIWFICNRIYNPLCDFHR